MKLLPLILGAFVISMGFGQAPVYRPFPEPSVTCSSTDECNAGFQCKQWYKYWVCRETKTLGESCGEQNQICASGLTCGRENTQNSKICVEVVDQGGDCSNPFKFCRVPLVCLGGTGSETCLAPSVSVTPSVSPTVSVSSTVSDEPEASTILTPTLTISETVSATVTPTPLISTTTTTEPSASSSLTAIPSPDSTTTSAPSSISSPTPSVTASNTLSAISSTFPSATPSTTPTEISTSIASATSTNTPLTTSTTTPSTTATASAEPSVSSSPVPPVTTTSCCDLESNDLTITRILPVPTAGGSQQVTLLNRISTPIDLSQCTIYTVGFNGGRQALLGTLQPDQTVTIDITQFSLNTEFGDQVFVGGSQVFCSVDKPFNNRAYITIPDPGVPINFGAF